MHSHRHHGERQVPMPWLVPTLEEQIWTRLYGNSQSKKFNFIPSRQSNVNGAAHEFHRTPLPRFEPLAIIIIINLQRR